MIENHGTLYQLIRVIYYMIKNVTKKNFRLKCKKVEESKRVQIIANGPSFDQTQDMVPDFKGETYLMNFTVNTELFEKYRPEKFFLMDPIFFDTAREDVMLMWENLVTKCKWDMELIMPLKYVKLAELVAENKHIVVRLIGACPMLTRNEKIDFKFYKNNFSMPPVGSVVMIALYNAIQDGNSIIYLHGVDYSYHFEIDQDNRIWMKINYFYAENNEKKCLAHYAIGEYWKVLGVQASEMLTFVRLEHYAKVRGIKIFNMSKDSQVDAFDKYIIN